MFCCTLLYVHSSIEIILMGKRELVALLNLSSSVILLPAHPAFFTHNFVSGMQSFYFIESQDALVLQTCHEK